MKTTYIIFALFAIVVSVGTNYSSYMTGYGDAMEEGYGNSIVITQHRGENTDYYIQHRDTVYIDDWCDHSKCPPENKPITKLKFLSEVHRLAYMQGVNACIENANARRAFTCGDLVETLTYKKDSVFVLNAFK